MLKRILAVLFVASILGGQLFPSGCSYGTSSLANKDIDAISQKIVQGSSDKNDVIKEFGRPAGISQDSSGREKWTYRYSKIIPFASRGNILEIIFTRDGKVADFILTQTGPP